MRGNLILRLALGGDGGGLLGPSGLNRLLCEPSFGVKIPNVSVELGKLGLDSLLLPSRNEQAFLRAKFGYLTLLLCNGHVLGKSLLHSIFDGLSLSLLNCIKGITLRFEVGLSHLALVLFLAERSSSELDGGSLGLLHEDLLLLSLLLSLLGNNFGLVDGLLNRLDLSLHLNGLLLFFFVLLLSLVELLLHLLDLFEDDYLFSFVLARLQLCLSVGDVSGSLLSHLNVMLMVSLILSFVGDIVGGSVVELLALLLKLCLLLDSSRILLESDNFFSNRLFLHCVFFLVLFELNFSFLSLFSRIGYISDLISDLSDDLGLMSYESVGLLDLLEGLVFSLCL